MQGTNHKYIPFSDLVSDSLLNFTLLIEISIVGLALLACRHKIPNYPE
jgi:hypothetical protein